jgi:hypothetical protein
MNTTTHSKLNLCCLTRCHLFLSFAIDGQSITKVDTEWPLNTLEAGNMQSSSSGGSRMQCRAESHT